jgi:hypothetical protein
MTKIKNIWHRVVSYFNLEPKKVEPVKEPQEPEEDREAPIEIDLCNLWGKPEDDAMTQAAFKAFGMTVNKGPHTRTIMHTIREPLLSESPCDNLPLVPPEEKTQIADDESNVSGGFKALKDFPPRDYFMGLVNRFLWEAFLYDNGGKGCGKELERAVIKAGWMEEGEEEEGEATVHGDQDEGEGVPKNIHHAVMEAYNKSQKFEDLDAETASWLKDNLAKVIDRLRQTGGAEGSEGFFDLAMLYHFDRDGTVKLEGLTIHKKGKTMTVTLDVPMPVTTGPMNKVLASLAETYTKEGKTREILQELGPKIKALHIEESSRKQVKGKTSGTKKPAKKPVKRKK